MKNVLLASLLIAFLLQPSIAQEKWTCFVDDDLLLVDDHLIKGVFEYTDGNLWFVTDRGINIYNGQHWTRLDKENKLMRKSVGAFLLDSKDQVWIGTGSPEFYISYYGTGQLYKGGVLVYDGKEWKPILTKDIGIKAPIVTQLFEHSNGDIWMGVSNVDPGLEETRLSARGAILRYSNGEWTVFKFKDLPCLSCEYVKGFYEDKNKRLWLWGSKGITYFEDGKFHRVSKEDGYLKGGRRITRVFEDSKQNFWVAGFGRIARYDGKGWTTFTREHGVPSSEFPPIGLTETKDNKILMTARNGVYTFNGTDTWEHDKTKFVSMATYVDDSGKQWIPTYKGMVTKEAGTASVDKDFKGVWNIINDTNGGTWFFTTRDGARRLKDGKWTHFNKDNQLPSDRVRFVHLTDNGTLWIATNKGICKCATK